MGSETEGKQVLSSRDIQNRHSTFKQKTVVIFTVTSANNPSNCMELEGGLLPLEEGKGRQAAQ